MVDERPKRSRLMSPKMSAFKAPRETSSEEGWRYRANCKGLDPELFYSFKPDVVVEAQSLCNTCPVQTNCHALAVASSQQWGVWAGIDYSPKGRRLVG